MTNRAPLIGQTTLGHLPSISTKDRIGAVLRAKARPSKAQQPMDIGLWSDEAAQLDLLDMSMFQQPVED